jgi:hypothetical protein
LWKCSIINISISLPKPVTSKLVPTGRDPFRPAARIKSEQKIQICPHISKDIQQNFMYRNVTLCLRFTTSSDLSFVYDLKQQNKVLVSTTHQLHSALERRIMDHGWYGGISGESQKQMSYFLHDRRGTFDSNRRSSLQISLPPLVCADQYFHL